MFFSRRELKDLISAQTKFWMEKKKLINKDKNIAQAEKERRIKDQQSQEVKRFMQERQTVSAHSTTVNNAINKLL